MRISQRIGVRGGLIGPAVALLLLAGCGQQPGQKPEARTARRVVCGTPAVAEIVFALGCGDRVVGVSEFTDWPPEAAAKLCIGSALAPRRESLLRVAPDWILSQGRSEALAAFAQVRGIGFLAFPLDDLADLRAAIAGFAAALGAEESGRELLAGMEAGFAAIPAGAPLPVFIALGHAPGDLSGLMTSGPGTFLDEIVAQAGGSNVFADLQILWPRVSQESLIRRRPALILDFQTAPVDDARRAALNADWERLGFPAGQVRILTEDYLLKPGPRAPQSAARIAAALGRPGAAN